MHDDKRLALLIWLQNICESSTWSRNACNRCSNSFVAILNTEIGEARHRFELVNGF